MEDDAIAAFLSDLEAPAAGCVPQTPSLLHDLTQVDAGGYAQKIL